MGLGDPLVYVALLAAVTSWIASYILVGSWIGIAHRSGFTGKDMNKPGYPIRARAGGFWSLLGMVFGFFIVSAFFAWQKVYLYSTYSYTLASLVLLGATLGFIDDLLGWKRGLPARYRILASAVIAAPLSGAVLARSTVYIPVVGELYVGILYPLLLVPIGVMGAANGFNMLAGYNGLEAGLALILFSSMGVIAGVEGNTFIVVSSIAAVAAILGFLVYNWYPARTFPGNSFTYGVGGLYAGLAVLGGYEVVGVFLFLPFFVEFALFLRGLKHGVYKENFGKPDDRGCLSEPYDRVYSLTHLAIRLLRARNGCATEKGVVAVILGIQLLLSITAIALTYTLF